MSDGLAQTYYVIPWVPLAWGCVGGPMLVAASMIPGAELGPRLSCLAFGLVLIVIGVRVVVNRLAIMRIEDQIEYRRLRVRLTVPLASAKHVVVRRSISQYRAALWDVVVVADGKDVPLPLASHYWFGAHLQRRADAIAHRLQIPIVDPVGEEWRSSRFLPMRLLGASREWLNLAVVAAVVAPVVVGMGLVAALLLD